MGEQKEDKYFHTENVSKNIITTIIGSVLMMVSTAAVCLNWFLDFEISAYQISIVGAVGFALLFMRDKVTTYLDVFVRRKIDNTK